MDADEFSDWLFKPPIVQWLEPPVVRLKQQFKDASAAACEGIGWELLFDKFDADGNGELDEQEFTAAVREECQLAEETLSSADIAELFAAVDADSSGAIDAAELKMLLSADLASQTLMFEAFHSSML